MSIRSYRIKTRIYPLTRAVFLKLKKPPLRLWYGLPPKFIHPSILSLLFVIFRNRLTGLTPAVANQLLNKPHRYSATWVCQRNSSHTDSAIDCLDTNCCNLIMFKKQNKTKLGPSKTFVTRILQ